METKRVDNKNTEKKDFKGFAIKRIALGVLLTFAGLWIFGTLLGLFEKTAPDQVAQTHEKSVTATDHGAGTGAKDSAGNAAEKTHGGSPAVDSEPLDPHTSPAAGQKTAHAQPAKQDSGHGAPPASHDATAGLDTDHGAATKDAEHVTTGGHTDDKGSSAGHSAEPLAVVGHDAPKEHGTEKAAVQGHTDTHRETTPPSTEHAAAPGQGAATDHGTESAADGGHTDAKGASSAHAAATGHTTATAATSGHDASAKSTAAHPVEPAPAASHGAPAGQADEHGAPAAHATTATDHGDDTHGAASGAEDHGDGGNGEGGHGVPIFTLNMPTGVAFIESAAYSLNYELNERWWGWRPNDIIDVTDNVNNFQRGVLEVTRRTAVALAERMSRTGSTASFDKNLENAMNWFMIKADRYWFPSPESKYKAGLDEWKMYRDRLIKGEANFYSRTDNLIPLLMAFEDLLGSCDENLVKQYENDGSPVSHFKADDYLFYAKGVASALHTILLAVQHDYAKVIESRRGAEVLHHAIESCHHAVAIDPFYITNPGMSGILANHRANMAAPISHARFYIGVLIKTLST